MRALVIGLGRMGRLHRKVLADLGLDVTTVDPDPRAGADYVSVPRHAHPDVVCVATPMHTLAEQAAEWAGFAGRLLIEKPAATSHVDALELAALLRGQRVAVGYVERFNPVVRGLRAKLAMRENYTPLDALFERFNTRPSPDVALDLESHDRDLAAFLGLDCPTRFDTRAGCSSLRRRIVVRAGRRWDAVLAADLTAHDTSPLHAQWHAFLGDRPGCATLTDAARVLAALERQPEALAA